jgi:hypothetical protein
MFRPRRFYRRGVLRFLTRAALSAVSIARACAGFSRFH